MSKKVLIPLASGFEEIEFISIADPLKRAGLDVTIASLTTDLMVKGGVGIEIKADISLDKVSNTDFDAIALPGGWDGMLNLKANNSVIELIKSMHSKKLLVAAVCASPIVLGEAGVLDGKFTCYPGCAEQVKGKEHSSDLVVLDGNIITSRGPATSILFAIEIIRYLLGAEKATEIRSALLVNLVMDK